LPQQHKNEQADMLAGLKTLNESMLWEGRNGLEKKIIHRNDFVIYASFSFYSVMCIPALDHSNAVFYILF